MNKLNIPFISLHDASSTLDDVDKQLDHLPHQNLGHLLWSNDGYQPKVSFNIAHNGNCILLKYTVSENTMRAVYNNINDPVYKDTCVEFFIAIENDRGYYNLEFNCMGTCTIGYGTDKYNRTSIPENKIKNIRSQVKIERVNGDFVYQWDITLIIPVDVFIYHNDITLDGLLCRLNLYKCGDDLPQPHFIAWNKIESDQPNFHLPEFFRRALFLSPE